MTIAVDIRAGEDSAMERLECVAFLLTRGNTGYRVVLQNAAWTL